MTSPTNPEQDRLSGATGSGRPPVLTWRDIDRGTRRYADELIATEAESTALEALRTATGEVHGDMERHTVRQYLIAERIADMRGVAYDRELLLCASFLHDSGLYGPASTGDVYIKDSARYARRTLEPLGWPEHRLRVCLDACEQHHAFRTRWWLPNEVELVRRSDLVEVVPELVRWGIPRSWLKRDTYGTPYRAPATGRLLTRFCEPAGGGCFRGCSGRRRAAGRPTESSSEGRCARITSAWGARSARRLRCRFGGVPRVPAPRRRRG